MNGPYPPVAPPKPPNIEVSHTVDVTSTANTQQDRKPVQQHDHPETAGPEVVTSSQLSKSTRQTRTNTRTSVFAESFEPSIPLIKAKPEPRIAGSACRARRPGANTPEIGIISFLCEYPRARVQSAEPKKNIIQTFLRPSNSEKKLWSGSKQKIAAATAAKRTSDGRGYSQIVIKGLYEPGLNKSTYKVNAVEEAEVKPKKSRRGKRLGQEMVKTAKKREPIETIRGDGESAVVTSDEMADSIHRNLNDGEKKEEAMRQERMKEQQRRERSPAPMLPMQKGVESNFGIDFSSILKRHEDPTASPKKIKRGSLNTSLMMRSESRPNVRDFAGEGSSNFIRSAFRRRSKSPTKKSPVKEDLQKQNGVNQSPSKKSNKQNNREPEIPRAPPPTPEVPDLSVYTRRINSIRDSVIQHAGLGALIPMAEPEANKAKPLVVAVGPPQSAVSQYHHSSGNSSNARNSSTSNGHSKSPSGISAGSNEIDNLSEVSSAIISDAQSISIHKTNGSAEWGPNGSLVRKPTRPGPAPTGPLPSLPEGHDVQLPATPRHSDSIQRPSPERSPPKSRQKTQPRYRFTPADESPTRILPSPTRSEIAGKPEESIKKPAALVRISNAKINDFPAPPLPSLEKSKRQAKATALVSTLTTSTSDNAFTSRAERIKKLKEKDLALERSKPTPQPGAPPPPLPATRTMPLMHSHNGNGHKDSIDYLIDSYDTSQSSDPWHRPQQPSLISTFSTSSKSQDNHRNSAHLSEISPIIVVAEQEPTIAHSKPSSIEATSSEYANGSGHSLTPEGEQHYPNNALPSPTIAPPDSRPISEYSSSNQQHSAHPSQIPHHSLSNPIANRPSTPYFPSTALHHQDSHHHLRRQNSHHSSQHHRSSLIDSSSDWGTRLAIMEERNLRLERMFLAVVDASFSISSGGGSQGRESGGSFGTGGRESRQGHGADGRDSRGENGERLYEGLLQRSGSGKGRVGDGGRAF